METTLERSKTRPDVFRLDRGRTRLEPLDRPSGLLGRVMFAVGRRMYGAVLTPLRVIYARAPRLAGVSQAIVWTLGGLSLPKEIGILVQVAVALENGCAFCADLAVANGIRRRLGRAKFEALAEWSHGGYEREAAESRALSEAERAAVLFAVQAARHRTSDDDFALVRAHFSERQTIEIAWTAAIESYYNTLNGALGIGSDNLAAAALRRADHP